jgi:hypothetical protein
LKYKSSRELITHFGLFVMQLLKIRPQPIEAVVEKVYFKYSYKKFVAQYSPSKPEEKTLWAISLKDGSTYFLGRVSNGRLIEEDYRDLRKFDDWTLLKGAERLWWHFR